MKYDEPTKKFVLNILKPLDDDTVKQKTELVLILKATSDGFKAGNAILVIEIEKDIASAPKFKKVLYQAEYPKSGTGEVALSDLDFDNVIDSTRISIITDSKLKSINYPTHTNKHNFIHKNKIKIKLIIKFCFTCVNEQ